MTGILRSHHACALPYVAQSTFNLLKDRFGAKSCGLRIIKGKGEMHTYFLENAPPREGEVAWPSSLATSLDCEPALDSSIDVGASPRQESSNQSQLSASIMPRATSPSTTALWLERASRIVSPQGERGPRHLAAPTMSFASTTPPPVATSQGKDGSQSERNGPLGEGGVACPKNAGNGILSTESRLSPRM